MSVGDSQEFVVIAAAAALETFIVTKAVAIAYGSLTRSVRLALCIACEVAIRPA